jgi:hypothetical protein
MAGELHLDVVEQTWAELGQEIRPIGTRIFVRTEKPPEKIGAIWLPPEYSNTFGRKLGGQVPVTGVVLSISNRVQPLTDLQIGERVFFFRLPFGWTHKMEDGTFTGWIDISEILGRPSDDNVIPFAE